jgi:hypothetical protein
MSKKVEKYEEKSRDFVAKRASKSVDSIFENFESLVKSRDIKGIFKYFFKEIDKKAYYLLSDEWIKEDTCLFEKIGFAFKLPGLRKDEERYVIYILMAYSKGFVIAPSSAHHPGDLERVIIFTYPYQRDRREYYYLNTAAHGYPSLFKEYLGIHDSLEKALQKCSFYFKPGDHAVELKKYKEKRKSDEKKEGTSPFLDKSGILGKLSQATKNFFKKIGAEEENRESHTFYLITPLEFRENLDIDFEGYLKLVVHLDSKLQQLKRSIISSKQRSIISNIEKILWRTPIVNVPDEIKTLYKKVAATDLFDSEIYKEMREIQLYVNEILKKVSDLRKESFYDTEGYLEKKSIQKFSELSPTAKLTIPLGLEMLLKKPLHDWGYPEKNSYVGKLERIFFTLGDAFYRAFQKITLELSQ